MAAMLLVRVAAVIALSATGTVAQEPTAPIVEVYGGECAGVGLCSTSVTGTIVALAVGGGAGGGEAPGGASGTAGSSFVELTDVQGTDVLVGAGGQGTVGGAAYGTGTPPGEGGLSSIGVGLVGGLEVSGGGEATPSGWMNPSVGGSGGGASGYSRRPKYHPARPRPLTTVSHIHSIL